jgi:MFS family permease
MMANLAWILFFPAEAAMIADMSVSSTRGRMFGIVQVAHPIGSIIAPLVGGLILDSFGWNAIFYAIVFSASIALIPALSLSETKKRKNENQKPTQEITQKNLKSRFDPSFFYPMLIFVIFNFFLAMGQAGLSQITPFYLKEKFNATSFQQGLFFSVGNMVPNLIMQPFGGWLADKYSRRKLILLSIVMYPFMMAFWPSMATYTSLLFLRSLITARRFAGAMAPASQAYLMDFSDERRRALASGISRIGGSIATIIGTPLLGYIYEQYGQNATFYAAALFPLPAIPIFLLLKEKPKDND